jgi:hypothetical protein
MNRALIQDHLAQAERHVAEGDQRIANHRARIDEADRAGLETSAARDLTFEETEALQETDLARIRTELEEANPESR